MSINHPLDLFTQPLASSKADRKVDGAAHAVHFYRDDAFLLTEVSRFIGAALGAGDAAVIIATRAHRDELDRRLKERGLDLALAVEQARYVALDAAETLSTFLVNGWPDPGRFAKIVGDVLTRAAAAAIGDQPRVAAFGEMVALLCADGKPDAAIRLEQLWNDLSQTHSFSLRCGYPLGLFGRAEDSESFTRICDEHSTVARTEDFASMDGDERQLRSIVVLEQKAEALEAEIEERKRVQRSLQRREAELADFLENALEGVQQVGPDQIIRWANGAQLELLGYPAVEYVGHPLGEFHARQEVFDDFWRRLMRREDIYDFPADLRCKDGSIKHVLIHSNGLWDDGRFVHTRCFIRDITEQKRMEGALRESVQRAEAAVHARDEFLSIASHELKTPVTALKGAAQLLRRRQARGELDDERLRRTLSVFQERADHLAQLTNDLIDVSRIHLGHLALKCDLVDLSALIRRAVDRERDEVDENHPLTIDLPLEPTRVWGDVDRLDQVLTNLLDNAVKYSPAGGEITVQLQAPTTSELTFAVRDRGIGLALGAEESIFEPFGRAANATAGHLSGMGLGLPISRGIVERHGGRIWAESPGEGAGTTVFVQLPRHLSRSVADVV